MQTTPIVFDNSGGGHRGHPEIFRSDPGDGLSPPRVEALDSSALQPLLRRLLAEVDDAGHLEEAGGKSVQVGESADK